MKSVLIKTIPGYEFYSDGRIWSEKKKRFLKGTFNKKGYNKVCVNGEVKGRHQWMAIMFLRVSDEYCDIPFDELDVHHEDGDKTNNSIKNLKYVHHSKHSEIHENMPVFKYGLDGWFICGFDSTNEAAKEVNGTKSCINQCCLGITKTAYGFQYSYEKQDRIQPIKPRYERASESQGRKVVQLTLEKKFVMIHASAHAAAKSISKKNGQPKISECCNGHKNSAYGSKWMWYDKYIQETGNGLE